MKSFENIIPRDFQGGVLVLKDGQVVFEYCQGNADHSTNRQCEIKSVNTDLL